MPQLYCQLASRPSPWLLGRTSAGLCTLQTACPLTVTYSGGSAAADTIAAGSAATVYGGSAATFDASRDVWVVLTVPASGALQVVKEADLATVVGDWAGLARVVQHSTEPYQPQAYLAAGGLGTSTPVTSTPLVSDTSALVLDLSPSTAPPAGWSTAGFDDSAWVHPVAAYHGGQDLSAYAPALPVWPTVGPTSTPQSALLRKTFGLPAAALASATLTVYFDAAGDVYLNGVLLGSDTSDPTTGPPLSFDVTTLLVPGGSNLLACRGHETGGAAHNTWILYTLTVTTAGGGSVPAPSAPAEGDLLSYQSGVWTRLPLGSSGQQLTVVSSDPAWATPSGGTVTSVGIAVPPPLSSSGGPVSTSGTITLVWASGQTQNRVLASPNGSSGAVSLRALVGNDIPVDASTIISSAGTIKGNYQAGAGVSISGNTISATGSGGSVTSVALTLPSSVFSTTGSPVTAAGTLAVSLQSQAPHTFWGGPASGSSAAPTFRALQSSDLPAAAGAGGKVHAHGQFI